MTARRKSLAAVVGVACCATLVHFVPQFEGEVRHTYPDPIGILTACDGHTGPELHEGQTFTHAQCVQQLQADLVKHAEGVLRCTPGLANLPQPGPLASSVSFAYNAGVSNYCGSSMAAYFNAGNVLKACAELPKWTCASVKPGKGVKPGRGACATRDAHMVQLPGLVKRRATERAICEGKLK